MIRQKVEATSSSLSAEAQIRQNLSTIIVPDSSSEIIFACLNSAHEVGKFSAEQLRDFLVNMDRAQMTKFMRNFFYRSTNGEARDLYGDSLAQRAVTARFSRSGLDIHYPLTFGPRPIKLDVSRIGPVIQNVRINIDTGRSSLEIIDELGISSEGKIRFNSFRGARLITRIPLRVDTLEKDATAEAVGGEADLRIGKLDNRTTVWAHRDGRVEIGQAEMPQELGVDSGGVIRVGTLRGRREPNRTKLTPADGVIVVLKVRSTRQLDIAGGNELSVLGDGKGRADNLIIEYGPDRDAPSVVSRDFAYEIPDTSLNLVDKGIIFQDVRTAQGQTFVAFIESQKAEYKPLAAGRSVDDASSSAARVLRKTSKNPFAPIR